MVAIMGKPNSKIQNTNSKRQRDIRQTNILEALKDLGGGTTNDPGIYHVIFLMKILEELKDFRKNIESASIWLTAVNKRANKKNFWNQYKVQKGQALLNPETYNQRSAG